MIEFINAANQLTWPGAFAVVGITAVIAWAVIAFFRG